MSEGLPSTESTREALERAADQSTGPDRPGCRLKSGVPVGIKDDPAIVADDHTVVLRANVDDHIVVAGLTWRRTDDEGESGVFPAGGE